MGDVAVDEPVDSVRGEEVENDEDPVPEKTDSEPTDLAAPVCPYTQNFNVAEIWMVEIVEIRVLLPRRQCQ